MTQTPARTLPDVAGDAARAARALDWVGMDRIAVPLRVAAEGEGTQVVPASVDVAVDLTNPEARGIHMSRLYLRLQDALGLEPPGQAMLRRVLQDCIDSQQGLSSRARLVIRYGQLLRRPGGWRSTRGCR